MRATACSAPAATTHPYRTRRHASYRSSDQPPRRRFRLSRRAPAHNDGQAVPSRLFGRAYSSAACSCGDWQMSNPIKGYVSESRKAHLAGHADSFPALRELLRLG